MNARQDPVAAALSTNALRLPRTADPCPPIRSEQRCGRIRREAELIVAGPVQELTVRVSGRKRIFRACANGAHDHGRSRRVGILVVRGPLVDVEIGLLELSEVAPAHAVSWAERKKWHDQI
jgi:hypothetical protein